MQLPLLLRRALDPITERVPIPILSGPNAWRWWGLASSGSGYASGRRAAAQMHVLSSLIRAGDVMWDVGAHHGYVTILAARRVGPTGTVHAFEPSMANRRILARHLRWNGCLNATMHQLALGSAEGESLFGGGRTSKMHALGRGEERVRVRRADTMVEEGTCVAPTFLKIDVEGAEGDLLEGCGAMLPPNARLVIAVHGADADAHCSRWLDARGFTVFPSRELARARDGRWRGDPDLYAVGPTGDPAGVERAIH